LLCCEAPSENLYGSTQLTSPGWQLLDLSGLALALTHALSKLFEYFGETVGNRFYKYKIILRL
jgi:hypothetical protein